MKSNNNSFSTFPFLRYFNAYSRHSLDALSGCFCTVSLLHGIHTSPHTDGPDCRMWSQKWHCSNAHHVLLQLWPAPAMQESISEADKTQPIFETLFMETAYNHDVLYILVYLGLPEVAESEVKCPEVVKNLRRNIGLHFLLQDAGGRAICRQRSLDVSLLQNLSQFDPGLHVIWVLFGHLL